MPVNSIWVIILAAGHSVRMGVPKGLLPVRGQTLAILKKCIEERNDSGFVNSCLDKKNNEQNLTHSSSPFNTKEEEEGEVVKACVQSNMKKEGARLVEPFNSLLEKVKRNQADNDSMLYAISEKAVKVGHPVAIVLGKIQKEEKEILRGLPVEVVHTDKEASQLSDSLRTAIQFSMRKRAEAVVIVLGDQPEVEPSSIQKVLKTYQKQQRPIVQASYANGPGHPVLFDKSLFNELLKVEGDQGARSILKKNTSNIHWVKVERERPVDLDTPEEYVNFIKKKSNT